MATIPNRAAILCGLQAVARTREIDLAEEIIIFDSTGVAIEDVAAAAVVYERAAAEL